MSELWLLFLEPLDGDEEVLSGDLSAIVSKYADVYPEP
jgi:hypothetical protein